MGNKLGNIVKNSKLGQLMMVFFINLCEFCLGDALLLVASAVCFFYLFLGITITKAK